MMEPLEYYAAQKAALFPIPAGRKSPTGIVESFKDNASTDPAVWAAWRVENPNCNFGVVAYLSQWITLDTDIKPAPGQSAEDARAEAWSMRAELLHSWGMDPNTLPHCQSAHGGFHDHFRLPDDIDAATLRQPDAIKGRINVRVKGYTVAAGSYYDGTEKNDAPGHYQLFGDAPPHPAPAALIEHCKTKERAASAPKVGTHDRGDVGSLICWMDDRDSFDAYEDWCALGMALKLECGDDAKELWALSHNETVTPDVIESKWESFASEPTANSVTLQSFMKRAHALGWTGTIRPSVSSMFGGVAQIAPGAAPTLDMAGVPSPTNPAAEENEEYPTPAGGFTKTLAQSLAGFMPPDYLVDGILQRRFCYSMTAQTGVGKTTVAMRLAAHVAIGKALNEIGVERGSVLYFAGENPTDIQMRWLGLCKEMNLDPNTLDIHVVEGSMHLSKVAERITAEVVAIGKPMALVIVDTAAAYFEEDNDNDNVQAGNHARRLRSLCGLPGGPCVLVLCHPTKNAQDDNLVPRGGGAFLNEVDGNIALRRDGDTIVAFALGKFRGPEFTPINFGLKVIRNHPRLVDTKGRPIPTIIAEPISVAEHQRQEERVQTNEGKVIELLCNSPGLKNVEIAKAMGWEASRVSRLMMELAKQKSVEQPLKGHGWVATTKAQRGINLSAAAAARPVQPLPTLTPMVLGDADFPKPTRPGTPPPMPPAPK